MSIKSIPFSHTLTPTAVTIREARYSDRAALIELAQLDSARVPDGRLVIAEVGGELRAALAVSGGARIADPFRRTEELLALLRTRADQLREARTRPMKVLARSSGRSPARLPSRAAA